MKENGEDDYLDDDHDYVVIDVPKKDIVGNDAYGSNENDDGYDVGIHENEEDEDEEDDDDGSH